MSDQRGTDEARIETLKTLERIKTMSRGSEGRNEFGNAIATPVGVLSYPKVWEPVLNTMSKKMEYQCSLLVPKQGADLSALVGESMRVVKILFGERYKKLSDFGPERCPLKDGDLKPEGDPANGHWILPASKGEKRAPFVVDKNGRPIGDRDEIYGGAIGLMWVQPMAYDSPFGKGVKFMLEGIYKLADGEPFGSQSFDPVASGYKAPELPDYVRDRLKPGRPNLGQQYQPAAAPARTSADQALINELKSGFGAVPVSGDDIPF